MAAKGTKYIVKGTSLRFKGKTYKSGDEIPLSSKEVKELEPYVEEKKKEEKKNEEGAKDNNAGSEGGE